MIGPFTINTFLNITTQNNTMPASLKARAVMAKVRASKAEAIRDEFSRMPVWLGERADAGLSEKGWAFGPDINGSAFRRVVSHIGTSGPKTQRIALRILNLGAKVGYAEFARLFSQTYRDSDAGLNPGRLDAFISLFHSALQEAAKRISREREWVSLAEMKKLAGNGE